MFGGPSSSVSDSWCDSANRLRDSEITTAQRCHLVQVMDVSQMITFPSRSVFSL